MTTRYKIKITTAGGGKPFLRQLPHLEPVWGDCKFYINEPTAECDLWVVYGGLQTKESVLCPQNATLCITNEPPSVKRYSTAFLQQFAAVQTCRQNIKHPRVLFKQQALPWWVGHKVDGPQTRYEKTYDELTAIPQIKKKKLISVIASNKTFTKGHKERVLFVEKLKEAFGDQIDIFGIGTNTVSDKWDAIAPYKYHIVIENTDQYADYWSEKLTDAYLAESFPIYHGCPNIGEYFAETAYTAIDIRNPKQAIETIKNILASDTYTLHTESILQAKKKILHEYQLFPMLVNYMHSLAPSPRVQTTLAPETKSGIVRSIERIQRFVRRYL